MKATERSSADRWLNDRSWLLKWGLCIAIVIHAWLPGGVTAAPFTVAQQPVFGTTALPPLVMLNIPKDHSLSFKAYTDYSDLNGDGTLDLTYNHSIDYYGYFDPKVCYKYSTTNHRFEPNAVSSDKYCNKGSASEQWSGNFLNWSTMTRIDSIRKLLYGGLRSTDTGTETVLERAYLPHDGHAFAKHYRGADIAALTPFTVPSASTAVRSRSTATIPAAGQTSTLQFRTDSRFLSGFGEQIRVTSRANRNHWMIGRVTWKEPSDQFYVQIEVIPQNSPVAAAAGQTYSDWDLENLSDVGISICNTTKGSTTGANQYSHSNTNPPLIRVARGDHALWASNERWQCQWTNERSSQMGWTSSNGNIPVMSGLNSSAENPDSEIRGLGYGINYGDYVARVRVCDASITSTERCKAYPSGSKKPVGLLQVYGDSDQMKFGLMTGSFDKNISGGVLRRNITNFSSEVNTSTNGTFTSVQGIVRNLNKMRIYGYDYTDGSYVGLDGCSYQQTGMVVSGGQTGYGVAANEGSCASWGNPISEVFLETLRYFAGKSATSAFTYGASSRDSAVGMTVETWSDPLSSANQCSPLSAIVFSPAASSYDDDQMGGFSSVNAAKTTQQLTDEVGVDEQINGRSWSIGGNGTILDNLCSSKLVSGLGSAIGICPESPGAKGTFNIAGAAWWAHTNRVRTDLVVPDSDKRSLKVDTYAVQLATSTPKISFDVNGKKVTIIPSYRIDIGDTGNRFGSGTIVDFKVIYQDATGGKFYVNMEDSAQGGDFDQDIWGTIEYRILPGDQLHVTTSVISGSSDSGQSIGYTITGTNRDGPHFHSGAYGFNYTDPNPITILQTTSKVNSSGGCNDCQIGDPPTTAVYTVTGVTAGQLNDPLWYAAKWGGFSDSDGNSKPSTVAEWDSSTVDGSVGSDGIPDNYFFVQNPLGMEQALDRTFAKIITVASSSSVAANATSLRTGASIYQARFRSEDWSGQLLAYPIDMEGSIGSVPSWDASAVINGIGAGNRVILTYNPTTSETGIPFRWANLSNAQKSILNRNISNVNDGLGSQRLDWLRGDSSREGPLSTDFRRRPRSILGDIVNSSPVYVGTPSAPYLDADYGQFRTDMSARTPMVYVGANDGMLHGFDAATGRERLAYIPGRVFGNLSRLTAPTYSHRYYVDGPVTVGDAKVNGNWASILAGALGGGGHGIYALDVTRPTTFSESNPSDIVLWEFTDSDDADLGYTFGVPQVVKMANGKFAVIIGNGYNNTEADGAASTTGQAAVYILYLDRTNARRNWVAGTDYVKLSVPGGSVGDPNGIANPIPVDVDFDGDVDYIYAGDLNGKLWKFDVASSSQSAWAISNGGSALFSATDGTASATPQPITGGLEVVKHPQGGYMVLFGTGRYIASADNSDTSLQTFYGIWDKGDGVSVTRSMLTQQSILEEKTVGGFRYRLTTNTAAASTDRGWRLDLRVGAATPNGERVVSTPIIRGTRVIFTTTIPSTALCDRGGTSWLMELDAIAGVRLEVSPFDVNNDKYFNNSDFVSWAYGVTAPVSGRQTTVGIAPTPSVITSGPGTTGTPREFKLLSGSSGGTESIAESSGALRGRIAWREILSR
jgi:type IV pilus assembly protein PilY1